MKKIKFLFFGIVLLIIFLLGYMKVTNMNINDVGLKILSSIKNLKGDSVNLSNLGKEETPKVNHDLWTNLLQQYVSENGKVNYKGFVKEKNQLERYLNTLSANPVGSNWSEAEQMTYWINAYNAFTVKLIVDHYPLKSIKDISNGILSKPWDIKFFKIGGVNFDLNTIEHEILRKQFIEPRIHFAINCASFSCPKLRNEAFVAERLEEQLEDQTKSFINNSDKNIINESTTKLSKIFNWFESDFTKVESISSFIKKRSDSFSEQNEVEYLEYIWTLNE